MSVVLFKEFIIKNPRQLINHHFLKDIEHLTTIDLIAKITYPLIIYPNY